MGSRQLDIMYKMNSAPSISSMSIKKIPSPSPLPQSIHSIQSHFPAFIPPNARLPSPPPHQDKQKKKKTEKAKIFTYRLYIFSQAIPNPTPLTAPPLFPLSLILLPSISPLSPLFCNPTTQLTPPPQISSPPCVVVPFAVLI